MLLSPNKVRACKGLLCPDQGSQISDTVLDSSKLLIYPGDIVIATTRYLSIERLLMTDVRLDVLCDVVSLSGHSIDSSMYVGDVLYGWWWWGWLLHDGTEWMFVMWLALPRLDVVVCAKGVEGKVAKERLK